MSTRASLSVPCLANRRHVVDCRLTRRILLIASTVGCFLITGSATADIIHVPKDYPTIQGAINVASKGDEIIVAPGTYNEQINFLGQAITLRGAEGPGSTIIDALGDGTVVTYASGEGRDTMLTGFTITGGGGVRAIHCFNESGPLIRGCLFLCTIRIDLVQTSAANFMKIVRRATGLSTTPGLAGLIAAVAPIRLCLKTQFS